MTEEQQDIDMAPMLALMVTLIPILLTTFNKVPNRVIGSALPKYQQGATAAAAPSETKDVTILLSAEKVTLTIDRKKLGEFPATQLGSESLSSALSAYISKNKLSFSIVSAPNMRWDQTVAAIDSIKGLKLAGSSVTLIQYEQWKKQESLL